MNIWVDADACPKAVKAVLFKAVKRRQVALTLIANQYIPTPRSKVIHAIQVAQGFDEADNAIVERVCAGDLVITADIPLAADVVAKQEGCAGLRQCSGQNTDQSPEELRVTEFCLLMRCRALSASRKGLGHYYKGAPRQ